MQRQVQPWPPGCAPVCPPFNIHTHLQLPQQAFLFAYLSLQISASIAIFRLCMILSSVFVAKGAGAHAWPQASSCTTWPLQFIQQVRTRSWLPNSALHGVLQRCKRRLLWSTNSSFRRCTHPLHPNIFVFSFSALYSRRSLMFPTSL